MAVALEREYPGAAEEAVRKVVTGLAAASAFRTPNLRRADKRKLTLGSPHRIALLPLEGLQDHRGSPAPKPIGWRFLLRADGEPLAAAEALATPSGGFRFGGLNEGPLVSGFVEALERAARLSETREGRFEPWLLLVPALNLAVLWLTQAGDEPDAFAPGDLILPLPPSDPSLAAYEAIPAERFLASLRSLARAVPTRGAKGG